MNDDRDDILNGIQPDTDAGEPVQPEYADAPANGEPAQNAAQPDFDAPFMQPAPSVPEENAPEAQPDTDAPAQAPAPAESPAEPAYPPQEPPKQPEYPPQEPPRQPEYPPQEPPRQPEYPPQEPPKQPEYPPQEPPRQPEYPPQEPPRQPEYPPYPPYYRQEPPYYGQPGPEGPYAGQQYRTQPPQYSGYYPPPAGNRPGQRYYGPGERPYDPYASGHPYPYAPKENENAFAYPETQPKGGKAGKIIMIVLLVLIFSGVLGGVGYMVMRGVRSSKGDVAGETNAALGEAIVNMDEATTAATPVNPGTAAEGLKTPMQIYKEVLPSSVGILVYSGVSRSSLASEGSGVIFQEDNDGKYTYIITCAHVISGASRTIMVQLYDETEYPAQVVGYDRRTDIGVIRIEASGLKAIECGDSSKLQVGETIYAIGNPGGTEFANTFTNGMVTALDRPVSSSTSGYTMECIQHNAAINPGNSGGALVNEYGQLVGINSMKIVAADYEGMGFAVPSSVFVGVFNSLIAKGYVANRPKVGISYLRAADEQAYGIFVAMNKLPAGSIIVAEIAEDSDFNGKLKRGDLITAINGEDLSSATDVAAMVEQMNVGDTITFTVVRIHTDYTYDTLEISGKLVEDRQTYAEEEEPSSGSDFDDIFGPYFDDPNFNVNP